MVDTASFAKLVPGFDFLQGLVKNAGSALPSIGQWVAPTLDPVELERRIDELRTVQFWLEQNAKMLGATIQALEVQRMTLSTLKTMNVQMNDLRESLTIKSPLGGGGDSKTQARAAKDASRTDDDEVAAPAASSWLTPSSSAGSPSPTAKKRRAAKPADKSPKEDAAAAAPSLFASIDPTQAWSALLQQFGQIAASAMKDSAADATKAMAGAMVKQGMDTAGKTFEQAVNAPVKAAAKMAGMATSAANSAGRAARSMVTSAKDAKDARASGVPTKGAKASRTRRREG